MKKFYLSDAVSAIEKELKTNITQSEIAKALNVTQMNICKRLSAKSDLKVSELLALQEHFNCKLFKYFMLPDAVEVVYYSNESYQNLIKSPKITSIWLDRELVHDVWEKDEKVLRCLTMPGASMDGGNNPIQDGTQLIIDTESTDILRSGVYAYITTAGLFVNRIKKYANGEVEFIYDNKSFNSIRYGEQELNKIKFTVIGRVIKALNISDV